MIYRSPDYCRKFRCIADKCRDNCCIGWEIDIDEKTADFYENVRGKFGEKLRKNISENSFILGEKERCPFLNDCNLCEIYINLGEDKLCQICTDHPRYFEWFGEVKEGGIGMCCEEAARIILSENFKLCENVVPDEECDEADNELFVFLCRARNEIFGHLQNDSLETAISEMLCFAEKLQLKIDNGEYEIPEWEKCQAGIKFDIPSLLDFMRTLEPIDEHWTDYIEKCGRFTEKIKQIPLEKTEYLRNIAVYFIYRYFLKGVFDGEIISRVRMAAASVYIIDFFIKCDEFTGVKCDLEECADIAKKFSKEVEYSEENMEDFLNGMYYDFSRFIL